MRFFGIEMRNGMVSVPGPISLPLLELEETQLPETVVYVDEVQTLTNKTINTASNEITVEQSDVSGLTAALAALSPLVHAHASAEVTDFVEAAQDAVGTILANTARIAFTYTDASDTITADLLAGSVANSFLADMAQATLKGRAAGAGTGASTDLSGAQVAAIINGVAITWALTQTFTVQQLLAAGGFAFSADTDTSIGSATANTIEMTAGGTISTRVTSQGIGVGGKAAFATAFPVLAFGAGGNGAYIAEDSAVADGSRPFYWWRSNGGNLEIGNSNRSGVGTTSSTVRVTVSSTVATLAINLALGTAGNKLLIKEGTNASMGVVTLVAGAAVVNTTLVTANSRIFLTCQALGTVAVATARDVTARVAGTSFTITSASAVDTSVIAWLIIEPA